jgi:hypothetical protein
MVVLGFFSQKLGFDLILQVFLSKTGFSVGLDQV